MRIGELANKYGVTERNIDYWTTMGLLHPSASHKNGYRDYENCEEEIKKILIVMAMDARPLEDYVRMLDNLPDSVWDQYIIKEIKEQMERKTLMYTKALEFVEELKRGN